MEKISLRRFLIVFLIVFVISQFNFIPEAAAQGSRGQPWLVGAVRAASPTSWNWSLSPIFNDTTYAADDSWPNGGARTIGSTVTNIYKFWYFRHDFVDYWPYSYYYNGWWDYSWWPFYRYYGYTYNYTYYQQTYSYLTWRLGSSPGGQDIVGPSTIYVGYIRYYYYYYTWYWIGYTIAYLYYIYYYYYGYWWCFWVWYYAYYYGYWYGWWYTYSYSSPWYYYNYSYYYQYNYSTGNWLYPPSNTFIINSTRVFGDGVYYHKIYNQRDGLASPEKRYYIDSRAPYYTITEPADNYVVCSGNSVKFTYFCSDYSNGSGLNTNTTTPASSQSYMEVIDASNVQRIKVAATEGTNTLTQPFTPAGTYRWRIVLKDRLGWTTTSPWRTFTIDNVAPPVVNMTYPVDNQWVASSNVTFKWNPSKDTGTKTKGYYVKIMKLDGTPYDSNFSGNGKFVACTDQANALPNTYTYTIADGDYKWEIFAEDNCGQRSTLFTVANDASAPRKKFRVDATPPTINVLKPDQAPVWYNEYSNNATTLAKFKADFSDNVSIQEETIKVYNPSGTLLYTDGVIAPSANAFPTPNVTLDKDHRCDSANGVWTARFWAKDPAGNQANPPTNYVDRKFQVDVTRPVRGTLTKVAGFDVSAQNYTVTSPIVNNSGPRLEWTAASDPAPQSGVDRYIVYVWDSSGNLIKSTSPTPKNALYYDLSGLTSGKYYWDVGVVDVAGNAEVPYTIDPAYNKKKNFIVDLQKPLVVPYNPPTPNSGTGGSLWVVSPTPNSNSANPVYAGKVQDDFGVYNYNIRLWNQAGTAVQGSKNSTTLGLVPLTTSAIWYEINPGISIMTVADGSYKWDIEVWDRCMQLAVTPPGNYNATAKLDFNVDTRPPNAGAIQYPAGKSGSDGNPLNGWIIPPDNQKKPTFKFTAANDNLGAAGYSGIKEYKIRLWWDPSFTTPASTYPEAPFLGAAYKDYTVTGAASAAAGTLVTFPMPDDLKNGRYYWDIWVCDNANNWRWYNKTSVGNYNVTTVAGDATLPSGSPNWFCIDCIPPETNALISEINDIWIMNFKPNFKWNAGRDSTPGSGRSRYELWVWPDGGGVPVFTSEILCSSAIGNKNYGELITFNPFTTAPVKPPLVNGRYYWDIKFFDVAGNYSWYKCGLKNVDPTIVTACEKFRVDGMPPSVGVIKYPKSDEWINQAGTRSINEDGDAVYSPKRNPDLIFTTAKDGESGLLKYHIILRDGRSPKVIIGESTLTAATNPELFAATYNTEFTFTPPWGVAPWPGSLKDGRYFWDVEVVDKTGVNTNYYSKPLPPGTPGVSPNVPVAASDITAATNADNHTRFRLDTVPPIVMQPDPGFPISETHPGIGNLLGPKYGYITTESVNVVNTVQFSFSKAVDDIGVGTDGLTKLDCDPDPVGVGSGVEKYAYAVADTRDMLKEHSTVNIWDSGYVIVASTTSSVNLYYPSLPEEKMAPLRDLTSASVYWTIYVRDNAGNEVQYVDRKLRIRHIPPNAGHLVAPPNGTVTTNRKPKFQWTLQ